MKIFLYLKKNEKEQKNNDRLKWLKQKKNGSKNLDELKQKIIENLRKKNQIIFSLIFFFILKKNGASFCS